MIAAPRVARPGGLHGHRAVRVTGPRAGRADRVTVRTGTDGPGTDDSS